MTLNPVYPKTSKVPTCPEVGGGLVNRQQLLADCHPQDLPLRLRCASPASSPAPPLHLPCPSPAPCLHLPLHLACTFPVPSLHVPLHVPCAFPAPSLHLALNVPAPSLHPAFNVPAPSPHLPVTFPCTSPYHEGGLDEVELQLGEGRRVSLLLHLRTRVHHNEAERYVACGASATHALTPIPGQGINRSNSRSMPQEAAAHPLAHTSKEASNLPEKPRNPQRQLCRAGGNAGSSTR